LVFKNKFGPKARRYKVRPTYAERSWRALQGYYTLLRPKVSKYITPMQNFPPVPPKGFKPFGFRPTVLDSLPEQVPLCKGHGQYGYPRIVKKRLLILKTDNFHLALSKTRRFLDFQNPKKLHYKGLDLIEFTKWKLLKSLDNFVYLMVNHLVLKTDYFIRLSRRLRSHLTNLKFVSVFRELSFLNLKGKWKKPAKLTYPFPQVKLKVQAGYPPKGDNNCSPPEDSLKLNPEDDVGSSDDFLPFRPQAESDEDYLSDS